MRHARNLSAPVRSLSVAIMLCLLAAVLAACGGTATTAATAPATAAGDPEPSAAPATPVSTRQVVDATRLPVPAVFESPAYGYSIDLPARAEVTEVVAATAPWDGASAVASSGPMVDQFRRTGDRLAFILAAPTDLDLEAWAAAVHAMAVRDHGCPDELADARTVEIDRTPAKVVVFVCQRLLVYEATMVRDGFGLIAKQITPPPGSPALEKESLDDFIWFLEPLRWGS